MSSIHPPPTGSRIFHDDDEHPWGESPHKVRSSSDNTRSSSSDCINNCNENKENDHNNDNNESENENEKNNRGIMSKSAKSVPNQSSAPAATATVTPRKPSTTAAAASGVSREGKPRPLSLAPPMGFSPSPQPLATKSRNHDSNDHHADHHVAAAAAATTPAATTTTATASTGQTPDLLAAIARRLGISPSKVEVAPNGAVSLTPNSSQQADAANTSADLEPPRLTLPAQSRQSHPRAEAEAKAEAKQALVQDAMKRRFAADASDDAASVHENVVAGDASAVAPDTPGSVPSVGLSSMLAGIIPEGSAVHHDDGDGAGVGAGAGFISPSKIRFADMLSICEEGEMTTVVAKEEEEEEEVAQGGREQSGVDADNASASASAHGGSIAAATSRGAAPPSSPSMGNGSHDLSAMCDYVMDGREGRPRDGAATDTNTNASAATDTAAHNGTSFLSAADTAVNMTLARAAVQDESTVYDDVEDGAAVGGRDAPSVYSEASTAVTGRHVGHSTHDDGRGVIYHNGTASELDMRGVSVYNHTATDTPVGKSGGGRSRAGYIYPESTDGSSGGSPSGSSSMPSAGSYTDRKGDGTDPSCLGCCLKFSREHWFLIATALLCVAGGLVGYGAAFGQWFSFSASSSSSVADVDSGFAGDGGDVVNGVDDVASQSPTGSPTALPDTGVTTVGDLSFQPKPAPVPVPVPPPTRRITPAPTYFRGHETFSFYVIGDVPYTPAEEIIVEHQIKNMAIDAIPYLDNEGAQFAVHVGDIMKGGRQADCSKWRYQLVENIYKEHCPIPSFMLPGDNDW
jgi:hypothetical protein